MRKNNLFSLACLVFLFWAFCSTDIDVLERPWAAQNFTDDVYKPTGESAATGLQNMENNFLCLKSNFSGSSAAANPVAGMFWVDTTNHLLKIRNEANSAWLDVYNLTTARAADSDKVSGITLTAGAGIATIGDLSQSRTIAVSTGGITASLIGTGAVTSEKIQAGAVTPSKFATFTAGDYIEAQSWGGNSTTNNSYTQLKRFYITRSGTVRVRWTGALTNGGAGGYMGAQVYINGSATGDARGSGAQYDDVAVSAGDVVSIYGYAVGETGATCTISKAAICISNPIISACDYSYYH